MNQFALWSPRKLTPRSAGGGIDWWSEIWGRSRGRPVGTTALCHDRPYGWFLRRLVITLVIMLFLPAGQFRRAQACAPASGEVVQVQNDKIVFYLAAHQDDWELFRGEQAFADLQTPNLRVVFIYTTAGDAGRTDGWWEAREQGAVAAVRCALPKSPLKVDIAAFRSHPILRYTCGNSASYFLRLPDGDIRTGKGYPATGFQSIEQLRDGNKPVTAVDKSTTYSSWQDFCLTLKDILESERTRAGATHPRVNAGDYDVACDPDDHYDHRATADALRSFAGGTYERVWWVGYDSKNRPENLSAQALENKKTVFLGYGIKVLEQTTLNANPVQPSEGEWKLWGARSYYRVVAFSKSDPAKPDCK